MPTSWANLLDDYDRKQRRSQNDEGTSRRVPNPLKNKTKRHPEVGFNKINLMPAGIEKEKRIRQLESEREHVISSYMASKEYGESRAHDFSEGFWYGDGQMK